MKNKEKKIYEKVLKIVSLSTDPLLLWMAKDIAEELGIKCTFPAEEILKGSKGYKAYIKFGLGVLVRDKSPYVIKGNKMVYGPNKEFPLGDNNPSLVVEMPLDDTIEKKRIFVQKASKHYRKLMKGIKDGHLQHHKNSKAPYASRTGLIKTIEKRNNHMKKIWKKSAKDGITSEEKIGEIKMWLNSQTIWNGTKGYKTLSSETIKRICYSKNM